MGVRFPPVGPILNNIKIWCKQIFSDYFTELSLDISYIIPKLEDSLKNNIFYPSRTKQVRSGASTEIREFFKDLIKIPFNDCGFMKNPPGWNYDKHIDTRRQCAINILLVDTSTDFDASILVDTSTKKFITIPYKKYVPLLLNTKKVHYVKNNSISLTRYVLSIGFENFTYNHVKEKIIGV